MNTNPLIAEARRRGFKRGAFCETFAGVRTMQSDRLQLENGNILAMGNSPFFLRFKGKWVAEVITKP